MNVSTESIPELNMQASLDGVNITPEDAFVLSRVNGHSSVEEIRQIVGFTAEKIIPIFLKLVEWKLVVVKSKLADNSITKRNFDDVFKKRLREKYAVLQKKDHFRTLELEWGASSASIEKQYFRLSKEFHPDRFFGKNMGTLKEMLDEVFNAIQQAHDVLSDEQQRKSHLEMLRTPKSVRDAQPNGSPLPKVTIPSNTKTEFTSSNSQFVMGQKEEAKGNFKAALNFYKMARMMDKDNKEVSDALRRVKEVLKKNPLMGL